MHYTRAGKTERLASQTFQVRPQCEMLALDLLHRQLPYCVLLGGKMPLIDTRLVCVIPCNTKGGEQSLEFQEHRILAGAHHIGQSSPGVMIKRMPQPPCPLFGPDETPHFIHFGGASRRDADGA